ncbi:MAG: type II toxin-antitoxin system VapC family toxin [Bryobacteraceae bacterium]|jgi:PIN domain nuclease of toxin-antitoxin system
MIKVQNGKLKLAGDNPANYVRRVLSEHDLEVLPVELEHSLRVSALPLHHKDPFDRILIAQALSENLPIVTADPKIALYPVETIW